MTIMLIDDWENDDAGFELELDGQPFPLWSSVGDADLATENNCGGANNDLGLIKVQAKVDHSGNSLTLRLNSLMDSDSNNESWGVRDLKLNFVNDGSSPESVCGTVVYGSFTMNENECPCPLSSYDNSGCKPCGPACDSCFGGPSDKCYTCAEGYVSVLGVCLPACSNYLHVRNGECSTSCGSI